MRRKILEAGTLVEITEVSEGFKGYYKVGDKIRVQDITYRNNICWIHFLYNSYLDLKINAELVYNYVNVKEETNAQTDC